MATAQADASQPDTSGPADSFVNLQIVSPNVGVGPLVFTAISLDTTVAQLKQKIRESLVTHPTDDQQRLIHRGRLLARDSDTFKDIFPEEVLRAGDKQTLHLVLRDITDRQPPAPAPSQPTPTRGQSPAPGNIPPQPGVSLARLNFHLHQRPHGVHNAAPIPPDPGAFAGFAPPGSHPPMMQQQQHHHLSQWMSQLQREAHRQHLMHQQQQRVQAGSQGPQDNTHHGHGLSADHAGGRTSPAASMPTNTVVREGYGPNGYWRVTVNETVSTSTSHPSHAGTPSSASSANRGPLSPADLANIMRGADVTQATQAMTNAMHRSTSGASLASMANLANFNGPVQPIQPGVTTPIFPGISRHGSRTATPDPWARTQSQPQANTSAGQPEVYILSSPTGPRGILINGSSETYVTPAPVRPPGAFPFIPSPYPLRLGTPSVPQPWPAHGQPNQSQGQFRPPQPQPQPQAQPQPQHQAQAQVQPRLQPLPGRRGLQDVPVRPFHAHPNNPGAGALIAAAWPHIWLIVRLVLFVWWFTSNDPSWSRWLTMVAIAIAVFLFNTGILNGIANQAWDPLRQHLEGLLPLAPPDPQAGARPAPAPRQAAGNGEGGNAGPAGNTTNPGPAQTAARLVAEHRNANAHWLLDHVRRLERAGLLFLASIAPGVAERHIAHLEAQERAERQRREAEEAAAAEVAAAANATTDGQAVDSGHGASENHDEVAEERQEVVPEQPPLIQV